MIGQLHDAGNTTTLANHLKLLEAAFLVSGLELFSLGVQRKRGSSPKLVLCNSALANALSTKHFAESIADTAWWGRLVENAVGAHLCNNLNSVEHTPSPTGGRVRTKWIMSSPAAGTSGRSRSKAAEAPRRRGCPASATATPRLRRCW
jgi:hypothetical protein